MGRGDCRNYYKGHMDKIGGGDGGGGGGRWVQLGWGGGKGIWGNGELVRGLRSTNR